MTEQTPIYTQLREGSQENPYVYKNENLIIDKNARAFLTEFPERLYGVEVQSTSGDTTFYETQEYSVRENEFRVDYESKTKSVTFHLSQVGQQLNFVYKGTGLSYLSPNQIYTELNEDGVMETLDVYLKNMSYLKTQIENILKEGSVSTVAGKSGIVTNGDIHLIDTVLDANAGNTATILPLGITLYPVKSKNKNYPTDKGFVITYKHSNIQTVQFFYPTEKEATYFRYWTSNSWSDWKSLTTEKQVDKKIERSALRSNSIPTLIGRAVKDVKGLDLSVDLGGLSGSRRLVKEPYKLEFKASRNSTIERISFPVNARGHVKLTLSEKVVPEPRELETFSPLLTEVDSRELYLQPVDVSHLVLFQLQKGKTYELALVDMSVDVLFESDIHTKDIIKNIYIENPKLILGNDVTDGYAYFYDMKFSHNIAYQEVYEARVDTEDFEHQNLKERLEKDFDLVYEKILSNVANIKAHGAIGDGVADDTEVIQNLLMQGRTIYIPNGIYNITKNIYLPDGSTVIFQGHKAILRRFSEECTYMFINGKTGLAYKSYNGNGNYVFAGGTIDMNSNNFPTVNSAFMLRHSKDNFFKNLDILDVANGHAFDLNGCINQRFEGIRALGWRDLTEDKSLFSQEAWQLSTTSKDIFPWSTADGTPNKNITLTNCETGNSDTDGSIAYNTAIGNHSVYTTLNASGVYLDNCRFVGGSYYAMRLYGINDFFATNVVARDFVGLLAIHGNQGKVYTPSGIIDAKAISIVKNVSLVDCQLFSKNEPSIREAIIIQGAKNSAKETVAYTSKINLQNVILNGLYERTTLGIKLESTYQIDISNLVALDMDSGIRGDDNQFLHIKNPRFDHISREAVYLTNTTFSELSDAYIINSAINGNNGAISLEDGCANNIVKNSTVRLGSLGKQRFGVYMDDQAFYCLSLSNYLEGIVGKALTPYRNSHDGTILNEGDKSYILKVTNGTLTTVELLP